MTKTPFSIEQAQAIGSSRDKGADLSNCAVTDELIHIICQNSHLVNISLEGTLITDAALQHLAQLPRLAYLWLNHTTITGAGFAHFGADSQLRCTHIQHTQVDDTGLQHIARLPRMRIVAIDHTRITWQGLLAVAHQRNVKPVSNQQFSAEQMAQFFQTQRELAKKSKIAVDPQDLQTASAHLQGFFDAMSAWEAQVTAQQGFSEQLKQSSLELYRQFCTEAHHHTPCQSASGMPGGTYGKHRIVDSERISKNRLYLYTQDELNSQFRFLLIRHTDGGWRLDKAQHQYDGGWSRYYL